MITRFPLYKSILHGDLSTFRALIPHNEVEVLQNVTDQIPYLHLSALAGHGNMAIVQELCLKGVNINAFDSHGRTALDIAILEGFWKMADFLLGKGAKLDSCYDGITSFGKFLQKPVLPLNRIIYFLKQTGTRSLPDPQCWPLLKRNVFHVLASADRQHWFPTRVCQIFNKLLQHPNIYDSPALINQVDRLGFTPLMLAVFHGHKEFVDALLGKGADANACGLTNAITIAEIMRSHTERLAKSTTGTREERLARLALEKRQEVVEALKVHGAEVTYNLLGLPETNIRKFILGFHPRVSQSFQFIGADNFNFPVITDLLE